MRKKSKEKKKKKKMPIEMKQISQENYFYM